MASRRASPRREEGLACSFRMPILSPSKSSEAGVR
jgi:hypothetical protein